MEASREVITIDRLHDRTVHPQERIIAAIKAIPRVQEINSMHMGRVLFGSRERMTIEGLQEILTHAKEVAIENLTADRFIEGASWAAAAQIASHHLIVRETEARYQ